MFEFQLSETIPYKAEKITITHSELTNLRVNAPAIVFVNEADIFIHFDLSGKDKVIHRGQFFLLSPDKVWPIGTIDTQASLLVMQIPTMTVLYIHYIAAGVPDNKEDIQTVFYPLPTLSLVERVAGSVSKYMEEGKAGSFLIGLKAVELFHILKHCFSKDKLKEFFTPILTKEYYFALFVLSNYHSVRSAKELCELSIYSPTHFERLFREIFGMPPYRWLLKKKINNIYFQIKDTNKPIKVIADEFGFASLSNLGDFCRKHFGISPNAMRKMIKMGK